MSGIFGGLPIAKLSAQVTGAIRRFSNVVQVSVQGAFAKQSFDVSSQL
jgi:hypothetical protein